MVSQEFVKKQRVVEMIRETLTRRTVLIIITSNCKFDVF